mgnify:FL=1|tara:strand:- start:87 stop:443 length:357 start_codon:yes stop_codon:yes gene_type:complete
MDKNRKRIEHMWAELLADFFDNDVFFDVMEEKLHSRIMPNERNIPHLKPFTAKNGQQVVGEAISPVGPSSFSVAPIMFDESALDPKTDEDAEEIAFREEAEMDEMSEKEINEHEKEED